MVRILGTRTCKRAGCKQSFRYWQEKQVFCTPMCRLMHNKLLYERRRLAREHINTRVLNSLLINPKVKNMVLLELADAVCFRKDDFIRRLLEAGFTQEEAERAWEGSDSNVDESEEALT